MPPNDQLRDTGPRCTEVHSGRNPGAPCGDPSPAALIVRSCPRSCLNPASLATGWASTGAGIYWNVKNLIPVLLLIRGKEELTPAVQTFAHLVYIPHRRIVRIVPSMLGQICLDSPGWHVLEAVLVVLLRHRGRPTGNEILKPQPFVSTGHGM